MHLFVISKARVGREEEQPFWKRKMVEVGVVGGGQHRAPPLSKSS